MEITKGENANLAGMEPRCPKCGSNDLDSRVTNDVSCGVYCRKCKRNVFVKVLADYAQFFRSPVPTPPLDVEGWKRPEDSLPDEDSDVLAAIWWEDAANPEESTYGIHDCAYYEGGKGSGQKIFTDCEGEEFEAKEVAFWIYKKDLAASLLRRHIASPAQPEKRDEWVSVDERLPSADDPNEYVLVCWKKEWRGRKLSKVDEDTSVASPSGIDPCFIPYFLAGHFHQATHWQPLPAPPQSGKEGQS